mmetsp:Transcript_24384/g.73363  ORF Transcript_24384/g.73363 Transcript_24384/m.73363 type:complete len:285 (+) Transcript_24384:371-1225(+)
MGAGYAETTDATAAGASAFYTLVLLTIALCGMVPSLLQRLAHKRFTKGTALLALLCAGAAVGASGLRPEAQAWADAAAAFDPHEILRVPEGANATVVRRSYRSLSRTHHPDKGGDAKAFRKIALAHAALAGAPSERRNYRDFGHPEGPRTSVGGRRGEAEAFERCASLARGPSRTPVAAPPRGAAWIVRGDVLASSTYGGENLGAEPTESPGRRFRAAARLRGDRSHRLRGAARARGAARRRVGQRRAAAFYSSPAEGDDPRAPRRPRRRRRAADLLRVPAAPG